MYVHLKTTKRWLKFIAQQHAKGFWQYKSSLTAQWQRRPLKNVGCVSAQEMKSEASRHWLGAFMHDLILGLHSKFAVMSCTSSSSSSTTERFPKNFKRLSHFGVAWLHKHRLERILKVGRRWTKWRILEIPSDPIILNNRRITILNKYVLLHLRMATITEGMDQGWLSKILLKVTSDWGVLFVSTFCSYLVQEPG